MSLGYGRYAPSPSSDLHLGNLRTAVVAYLAAKSAGLGFRLRIEDLDPRSLPAVATRQLADLARLGLTWDGPVVCQSDRAQAYDQAIDQLTEKGLVYPCFCSRREIREAVRAPHGPPGAYGGTCRRLNREQVSRLMAERPPAWRLASDGSAVTVNDALGGQFTAVVDDFVLRRSDGVVAYNLAVVVDDAAQGVTQVVRGDDLLDSSPRQAYLAGLLGLAVPSYLHVPLVMGQDGRRLAKRDGVLAGDELFNAMGGPEALASKLGQSLGLLGPDEPGDMGLMEQRFQIQNLPREPWVI